jgi:hypothetical protein
MTRALFVLVLLSPLLSACQKSDCEAIREHATDCRNVASNPAGRDGGICEKYRDVKGKAGMETFATCTTRLRCDDKVGLAACIDESTNADAPACERLNGYLVACGLEPASGGLSCSEYGGAETLPAFTGYVQCVIDRGCLTEADTAAALDDCRSQTLGSAAATFTACQRVEQRAQACSETQPTIATCSLQIAAFTAASVDKWAECYLGTECGDFTARARCAEQLELAQTSDVGTTAACNKVGLFQLRCGVRTLPVIGDPATCVRSLDNFSDDSAGAFADCLLEVEDCNDAAGLLSCAGKLQAN